MSHTAWYCAWKLMALGTAIAAVHGIASVGWLAGWYFALGLAFCALDWLGERSWQKRSSK